MEDPDRNFVSLTERRLDAGRQSSNCGRLEVPVIYLVNQALRLRYAEMLQQHGGQRRRLPAVVGLPQHGTECGAPDPITAAFIAEDVSPASRSGGVAGGISSV